MTVYEPVTLTWILISVLTLAFSGELFAVFSSSRQADCHARNERLLVEQREGPRQECK